jgi:hypothetical protein
LLRKVRRDNSLPKCMTIQVKGKTNFKVEAPNKIKMVKTIPIGINQTLLIYVEHKILLDRDRPNFFNRWSTKISLNRDQPCSLSRLSTKSPSIEIDHTPLKSRAMKKSPFEGEQ